MKNTLERLYWFDARLQEKRYPSREQYTEEFEVSGSTFKRDLDFYRHRLYAPVEYDKVRHGYYLTDESFELPSVWFSRPHLFLMLGACRQIQLMAGSEPEEIGQLRRRLEDLLSLRDGHRAAQLFSFENAAISRCDCRHVEEIIDAALRRRCLEIVYYAAHSGEIMPRIVEPYRLHNYMGSWYLVGFCRNRGEPRTFLLGRIRDLLILPEKFQEHRFDVDSHINASYGIFKGESKAEVILRFSPFLARFVRTEVWHEDQIMQENEDGTLLLTVPVADLTEIKMRVLQFGSQVEVLAPAELREMVRREAEETAKLYRE